MMGTVCGIVYVASIFASLVEVSLGNSYSNGRIMEMGYELKSMKNNSLVKNVKYFLKAYGFSFIPVYNLFASISKSEDAQSVSKSISSEYHNRRIKLLEDSGLLVKATKKISSPKKVTKKIEVKEVKKLEAPKEKTMPIIGSLDAKTCYERREFYKKEYEKSCRECELDSLKAERNFLLSNMGDEPIKLTRK